MIKLSFLEFFNSEFTDEGYELYIVKDNSAQTMYIGISRDSVWNRWFGGLSCHMEILPDGQQLRGHSQIGEAIERRLPTSWNWGIELWTRDDCIRALLEDAVTQVGGHDVQTLGIIDIEGYLIQTASPPYNRTHAGGGQEDPLPKEKLDAAYNKIFNAKHR